MLPVPAKAVPAKAESISSDISIQSRKYKIVDEEPLRRLCSDQYIFILFVYLLIMTGVWREVIYTR